MSTTRQISPAVTPWAPLRRQLFRALWTAQFVSNIGTWMQNVGAAWLMTTLKPSPLYVALVQTATSLPIFLVGLAAGALADIIDRRRYLLVTQTWMLLAAATLGVTTTLGGATPWALLALTFALGLGAAMNGPAWQAIMPELVPRDELAEAIALNSVGFNLARAAGPALGGIVVAASGPGAVFLLNALSFVGVVAVLYVWKRPAHHTIAATERVMSAIRAGLRYVRHEPQMISVLVRAGIFILCASAVWAVLPLLAKTEIGHGSAGYGLLVACLGIGSVTGAAILTRVRRVISTEALLAMASLLFGGATIGLAYLRTLWLVALAMGAAGVAWMSELSTLNVAAQQSLPAWVRARGLAVYLLVFQGGMAAGAFTWGAVAERIGLAATLLAAGIAQAAGAALALRFRIRAIAADEVALPAHWPEPVVTSEPHPEAGPVMVVVEYRVRPEQFVEFQQAMREVGRIRRRNGALRWGLFVDAADPDLCREVFLVESWAEHMRQHARVTAADRRIEQRAHAYHSGEEPPRVQHWIAAPEG